MRRRRRWLGGEVHEIVIPALVDPQTDVIPALQRFDLRRVRLRRHVFLDRVDFAVRNDGHHLAARHLVSLNELDPAL